MLRLMNGCFTAADDVLKTAGNEKPERAQYLRLFWQPSRTSGSDVWLKFVTHHARNALAEEEEKREGVVAQRKRLAVHMSTPRHVNFCDIAKTANTGGISPSIFLSRRPPTPPYVTPPSVGTGWLCDVSQLEAKVMLVTQFA